MSHRLASIQNRHLTYEQRFWMKVDKRGPDDCWLWTGAVGGKNAPYGTISAPGRHTKKAHRQSLEWHLGRPLRQGMWALHTCDIKLCVNPAHLYEGTHADNTRDALDRDHWPKGERNGLAKLAEAQVMEIRAMRAAGTSQRVVAEQFGVSILTVSLIHRRKTWKHLTQDPTTLG